jgi:hypothetical protein
MPPVVTQVFVAVLLLAGSHIPPNTLDEAAFCKLHFCVSPQDPDNASNSHPVLSS